MCTHKYNFDPVFAEGLQHPKTVNRKVSTIYKLQTAGVLNFRKEKSTSVPSFFAFRSDTYVRDKLIGKVFFLMLFFWKLICLKLATIYQILIKLKIREKLKIR